MQRLVEHNVMPTIYQTEDAEYLSILATEAKKSVKVHIKLATGMNRLGFVSTDPQTVAEILKISRLPGIQIEGIDVYKRQHCERGPHAAGGQGGSGNQRTGGICSGYLQKLLP